MSHDLRWVKTHCARMDHGGCALLVGVRDNRIIHIKGDPEGFLNKGYTCIKGIVSPDRLSHPDRLLHPLKRAGKRGQGKWKRISWGQALNEIAENFNTIKAQYGARGVAFCVGMPKGLDHFVLIRLANLFGSPNVVASQDVCHAPREITGIHTCGFYPVVDLHYPSRLVVLWGSNLTSTNEEGEICSMLLKQFKEGTELIVIDPRRTYLARKASLSLQIRPGTDAALALGFLHVIIEEFLYDRDFVAKWTSGFNDLADHVTKYTPEMVSHITRVPPDSIREAARRYAQSKPAAIQWGNPIEQNVHTFHTVRALICLMAICGNLDVPGGNLDARDPKILSPGSFVRADLLPDKRKEMIGAYHHVIPRLMTVAPSYFKKAILEGIPYPVKAAYIMCANPLLSYANSHQTHEALMHLDFLAVAEIFMTPTAALADIVLPVASHFEFDDIGHYGLGHGYILARSKVVDPPEECWPDIKILNELGKRVSPPEHWHEDHRQFLEDVLKPSGLSYRQFVDAGYLKGTERFKKYEDGGFGTPTGKVELRLSTAEKFNLAHLPGFTRFSEEDDPDYPLVLTGSKNRYYLHSSYRWLEKLGKKSPHPKAEIHHDTAEEYGINDGEEVIIKTRYGAITQVAHLTEDICPGIVNAEHGWWYPEAGSASLYECDRANFNILTSTHNLGREFGTPNLKGIGCRISKR